MVVSIICKERAYVLTHFWWSIFNHGVKLPCGCQPPWWKRTNSLDPKHRVTNIRIRKIRKITNITNINRPSNELQKHCFSKVLPSALINSERWLCSASKALQTACWDKSFMLLCKSWLGRPREPMAYLAWKEILLRVLTQRMTSGQLSPPRGYQRWWLISILNMLVIKHHGDWCRL